ncbi:MAG: hypothetical protein OHK93_001633 [Ramalina farinacea]|uniref:Rhodopsin domain-containing protein n=1 Tax=Ramalina farinacea TaxID=258253 RepID=A0AA43QUA1_9LECA|nr:hypothetical protein [Ramalina farinacea]
MSLPPPTDPHALFIYNQNRAGEVYAGTLTLLLVATISVALRFLARKLSSATFCSCYWIEIQYAGLGRHTVQAGGPTNDKELVRFFKIFLAIQILYFTCAMAIKTSLLLLYYRIFSVVTWFRHLLLGAFVVCALYFLIDAFVAIFECTPVAFYWNHTIEGGHCINQTAFYRWNGVANLLIDFGVLGLTMPMIWRLNLATRQKISLSLIFLLGLFACVASIIRVIAFNVVKNSDITYTIVQPSIWTTIEQSTGIICACLPTLRPLFGRLLNSAHSRHGPSKQSNPSSGHTSEQSHHGGGGRNKGQTGTMLSTLSRPPPNDPTSTFAGDSTTDFAHPSSPSFAATASGRVSDEETGFPHHHHHHANAANTADAAFLNGNAGVPAHTASTNANITTVASACTPPAVAWSHRLSNVTTNTSAPGQSRGDGEGRWPVLGREDSETLGGVGMNVPRRGVGVTRTVEQRSERGSEADDSGGGGEGDAERWGRETRGSLRRSMEQG